MRVLIAIALLALPFTARTAELPGTAWSFGYLFATWEPGERLLPLLEGISAVPELQNPGSLDYAAELLIRRCTDKALDKGDALALVKLVARTQSGRYRTVMEQLRAKTIFGSHKVEAREYLKKTRLTKVEQYIPGTLDFDALRKQFMMDALAVKPTEERARALDQLKVGDTIEDMFRLAGPPQHITTRHARLSQTLNFRRMLFYFRGAGRAIFSLDDQDGWRFQSVVADPLAFEDEMPYRAFRNTYQQPTDDRLRMIQLVSQSLSAVKISVNATYDYSPAPLEFLDTAAQLLSENYRKPADEVADETYAWIARLLVHSGGPRYADLLAKAAGSPGPKIARYAAGKILPAAQVPRDPFVPGSISLAEQVKKYPSLYPEVTYVNGRL